MQGGYRKADMIELHDPGIVVHVDDFPVDGLDWRASPTVAGTRFALDGNEAARLFEALGVTFDADLLFGDEFDVVFRRPVIRGASSSDEALDDDGALEGDPLGGVLRIREIRVRTEGSDLLHIHISSVPGGSDDEDQYVQELTYSGNYTIWWSTAEE